MARFPEVGDAFGAYRLVGVLGSGARGVAFAGFDSRLSRQVAVKVIRPELSADPAYRERFVREAGVLTGLNALHVTQLYEHGEQDGCLYLVAQLVPEGDFAVFVETLGRLSPKVAQSVIGQLCEAVRDLHAAGIAPADLKPSDVLVRDRGSVLYAYLGGFSVAAVDEDTAYLAPERHAGAPADVRSTVYSLGCLLWFALTGVPPYVGSEVEVAMAHLHDPVPQLENDEDSVGRLNEILRRALAKDPDSRYAGPVELAEALGALVTLPATVRAAVAAAPPLPVPEVEPAPVVEVVEVVETPVEPSVEPSARPLFADDAVSIAEYLSPDVEPLPEVEEDQTPAAPRGWRARRAAKRARRDEIERKAEPEPELEPEPEPDPEPDPEPEPEPESELEPELEPKLISARARRKAERPPRDLGWLLPGGMLLVVPVLAVVGVFILVNGKGGSNYGQAATTPPQTISETQAFSVGAFTADPGWKVVDGGPLWQVSELFVLNVSTVPEAAHFTLKLKKGKTVLVALDCRTAELLPAQRQAVSCDDAANAPYDPAWDAITVEQAY